jgi:hypothetical protein
MVADRTTKVLLVLIAVGIWANLATPFLRPNPTVAQREMFGRLSQDVGEISTGFCMNKKIC